MLRSSAVFLCASLSLLVLLHLAPSKASPSTNLRDYACPYSATKFVDTTVFPPKCCPRGTIVGDERWGDQAELRHYCYQRPCGAMRSCERYDYVDAVDVSLHCALTTVVDGVETQTSRCLHGVLCTPFLDSPKYTCDCPSDTNFIPPNCHFQCPAGHICNGPSANSTDYTMTPCPAGHLCRPGLLEPMVCRPGTSCPEGSSKEQLCTRSGFYCPTNSSAPLPCPEGYKCPWSFDSQSGERLYSSAVPCPHGLISPKGQDACRFPCESDEDMIDGQCVRQSRSSTAGTVTVVAVVPFVGVALCACIVAVRVYRRKQQRKRQRQLRASSLANNHNRPLPSNSNAPSAFAAASARVVPVSLPLPQPSAPAYVDVDDNKARAHINDAAWMSAPKTAPIVPTPIQVQARPTQLQPMLPNPYGHGYGYSVPIPVQARPHHPYGQQGYYGYGHGYGHGMEMEMGPVSVAPQDNMPLSMDMYDEPPPAYSP